ncbi:MAG TPA: 30S ribosomal protein S5 [bacterium]|jgi:small subunit ribosomal protein S5|nr:30S ribosomal protein S5 [bacterium]MDX9805543.1 30S ribosomal protein S5 [bacterium]HNW16240.1 30S ribosomal protein S5 [bacterium]HNZ54450.1 30S ribosomal protein S5 [bacterium]HPA56031.1 30S ribosomal protein S5 [bacterium]
MKEINKPINPEMMELNEKLVYVNRVAKVVKGGKNFSFAALMVVGDGKGFVGIGLGKAREVPEAIRKGVVRAKKNLCQIKLLRGTVPHEITGEYGAGKVILRPASAGTGVIAGSAVRAVLEAAGVTDILSKSIGSNNPHNMAKATLNALLNVETIEEVEAKRNVGVKDYQLKEKE